jgi:two-component system, OmpR family, alkaline phosphatase synthesis response regulator PhoP
MLTRILVIDDNSSDRKLIKDAICELGLEVLEAETGEMGVDVVEKETPDIVVIDTNLTGIDGFETCRQIRAHHKTEPKIIMITGAIDAVDAVKASKAGADDYSVKTDSAEEIMKAVTRLLK